MNAGHGTIVDLSFFGMNAQTIPLGPSESMQFGCMLQLLLQKLVAAAPYSPMHLIKVDNSDCIYWIHLYPLEAPAVLGVAFPSASDKAKVRGGLKAGFSAFKLFLNSLKQQVLLFDELELLSQPLFHIEE